MSTGLVYSDRFLEHDTGPGHPERPARLRAIVARLQESGLWDRLTPIPFGPAEPGWIERLHTREYLARLDAACRGGAPYIDAADSAICSGSAEVARLAVGGLLAAADAVMASRVRNAFCAVRPPGHHAEADRSMGFCLLANVALAAEYLLAHHRLERVAVVDFDVHHGNGTQHLFEDRGDVLFVSLHEHPAYLYPGTGFAAETGRRAGAGLTLNLPLEPGGGDDAYRTVILDRVTPALEAFRPQFLLLSAGFDAAAGDPLAHMRVTPAGFAWITRHLAELAGRLCGGRLLSSLEGGYDLQNLADGVERHLAELLAAGEA